MTLAPAARATCGVASVLVCIAIAGCSNGGAAADGSGGSGSGTGTSTTAHATTTSTGSTSATTTGSSTGSGPVTPNCSEPPSEAPGAAWENVTANLANMPSECGNLTIVVATPCSTQVIAGVAQKGLWQTTNGGQTWEALGTGAGSAVITNRPSSIVHDAEHQNVFWTSGIYNGGGVYKSLDLGVTLEELGTIGHNDLVSVDFSNPERKTLLAGGHEQKQTLYRSTDGGQTWTNVGRNLPANSHFSSYPLVIDANTHLLGACGWGNGTCGIWRTTNGGTSWDQVSDLPAQAAPLWASNGAIYWPLNDGTLAKSTDAGKSFTHLMTGLALVTPAELPDGRLVSFRDGKLAISSDGGDSWSSIGEALPYQPAGLTYSAQTRSFYVWHWDCGVVVLPDAIQRAGFDYLAQ